MNTKYSLVNKITHAWDAYRTQFGVYPTKLIIGNKCKAQFKKETGNDESNKFLSGDVHYVDNDLIGYFWR